MTVAKAPYISYDPDAKAVYIRLNENKVARTKEYSEDVYLDFDSARRLVGIEILWVKAAKISIHRQINKIADNFRIPVLKRLHPEKLAEVYS